LFAIHAQRMLIKWGFYCLEILKNQWGGGFFVNNLILFCFFIDAKIGKEEKVLKFFEFKHFIHKFFHILSTASVEEYFSRAILSWPLQNMLTSFPDLLSSTQKKSSPFSLLGRKLFGDVFEPHFLMAEEWGFI